MQRGRLAILPLIQTLAGKQLERAFQTMQTTESYDWMVRVSTLTGIRSSTDRGECSLVMFFERIYNRYVSVHRRSWASQSARSSAMLVTQP